MSPLLPSPLTVLTSPDTTTPITTFTLPTIVALILLALLTMFLLGALLVFILRRQYRQPETPGSSETQDDSFLDLEAGSKKSPFFEVVDPDARSSPSVWTGITDISRSRPRVAEPEQSWPVHTVVPYPYPRASSREWTLNNLAFWRNGSKREPFSLTDVQRTEDVLNVESEALTKPPHWSSNILSLFRRTLPQIVIHPSDGSPAFLYVEDLDSTPASLRARRLLERCEAVAFYAVDSDFDVAFSQSQAGVPSSVIALPESSTPLHQETDPPHFATPMRPATPLGMTLVDEPASSFVDAPVSDVADLCKRQTAADTSVIESVPRVDIKIEVVRRTTLDDISPTVVVASCSSDAGNAVLEDDKSTPSNSSSESSVADIISILEDISIDSSGSSDSLSLRTSSSDDSMALRPSPKRFSGAFDPVKLVNVHLSDLDLDPDGAFSRSTYYGVLDDYRRGSERDSVASEVTLRLMDAPCHLRSAGCH
ncbi:hypothetical protein C8T65DRAFT_167403 [Cerioporus squamosus]|nr:hypothetical protein C8T65DRAFT_167403 [Cerioporus squamosus]